MSLGRLRIIKALQWVFGLALNSGLMCQRNENESGGSFTINGSG